MNEFEDYSEKFRAHLLVLNYAPRSIESYGYYLKQFFRYLRELGLSDLAALTPAHLRDYQSHLWEKANESGRPLSPNSQNSALQGVKVFFRVMKQEGYLAGDPARDIPFTKLQKRLPRSVLTRQEMKKLLDAPNVHTVLGYRDRAVLELMYSTAMRRAEVEALKVEDVDFDGGFVRVNEGKGRKDRVVPLGKVAGKYLENYLKVIRPELVKDPMERGLFLGQYGNPLTGDVIWRMVKQYARKAGLTKNVYPHSFRHTCATLMMKNKANIRHIQELLGHASLLSTQVYTAVSIVDLKEAHRKYHPREREKG